MLLLKFIALMSLTLIFGSLTFYDFGLFPYFYLHSMFPSNHVIAQFLIMCYAPCPTLSTPNNLYNRL